MTWIAVVLPEGKLLWGGPCQKVEIDIRPADDPENPEVWEKEISRTGKGGPYVCNEI